MVVLLALGIVLLLPASASATWSLVAVDEGTGEVGVAMAACGSAAVLGDADQVLGPAVLVPGRGVGVVQGVVRPESIAEMEALIGGASPSATAIIESLLAAEDDPDLIEVRQYGLALLNGTDRVASHNGDLTDQISHTVSGTDVVAVGVRTVDQAVVDEALRAFSTARNEGLSLAESLTLGLQSGSSAGGDIDCAQDQTALFAHLAVAHPADGDGRSPSTLLTVTVDADDGQNPVELLVGAYQDGQRGWINAGMRSPTLVPRWLILVVGLAMAAAAVAVIRRGMGFSG